MKLSSKRQDSPSRPPLRRYTTLSLLLLLTAGIVGNDHSGAVVANAQTIFDDDDHHHHAANSTEQILYSNPQFFTIPKDDAADVNNVASASSSGPLEAQSVIGLLFNVRSKLPKIDDGDDSTIYITGFEFYTSMSGTVFYELWSREGTYYDEETGKDGGPGIGTWASFDRIAGGLADGAGYWECTGVLEEHYSSSHIGPDTISVYHRSSGNMTEVCPLTIVPEENFVNVTGEGTQTSYPWSVRADSTRSFYITLASKHLVVMPGADSGSFDSTVAASTPDLELYEGVATQTYPLHEERGDFYHSAPMGFIGKIHYYVGERSASSVTTEPSSYPTPNYGEIKMNNNLTGTNWTEPNLIDSNNATDKNNGNVTEGNEAQANQTLTPYPTLSPVTPVPTPKPTRRCRPGRPCLSPPGTATPTSAPLISSPMPTTIELMVYMENVVSERPMFENEVDKYIDVMTDFLKGNANLVNNGVKTSRVKIFYQNVYFEEEKQKGGRGRKGGKGWAGTDLWDNTADSFTYNYNTESLYVPKTYPTIYVMTTVEVVTKLPHRVAAFFLWDELRDNEVALMETFDRLFIVDYFRDLTNITFEMGNEFTKPPTPAPIEVKEDDDSNENEIEEAEQKKARENLVTSIGVGVGCVWIFLTLCSVKEILKHRHKAKEEAKLSRHQNIQRRQSRELEETFRSKVSSLTRTLTRAWPARNKEADLEETLAMEGGEAGDSLRDSVT